MYPPERRKPSQKQSHQQTCNQAEKIWHFRTGTASGATYISMKEIAMFKVAVVAFAFAVSGFMLWIAHEDANYAQRPHAAFVKRAA
jgi:hypothetical protein